MLLCAIRHRWCFPPSGSKKTNPSDLCCCPLWTFGWPAVVLFCKFHGLKFRWETGIMFVMSQFHTSRFGSVSSVGLMALGFHREHRDAKCMAETNTARPVSEYVEWLLPDARLTASAIKRLRKKRWPVFFQTLVLKTLASVFPNTGCHRLRNRMCETCFWCIGVCHAWFIA